MAGPSWAHVAKSKVKLTTPYKITYSRQEPNPVLRLQQVEKLVRELLHSQAALEQENLALKQRIYDLEQEAATRRKSNEKEIREVVEECFCRPDQGFKKVIQSAVAEEGGWGKSTEARAKEEEDIQRKIQASFAEEKERAERALNIRFGGLERDIVENLHQQKENREDLFARQIQEKFGISLRGISRVYLFGPQVVVTVRTKQERIDILRQAPKLKGSKTWMAEDLTRNQLSRKKSELQKVKQARADGYWAKYQNGEAVIRKFREAGKCR